MSLISRVLHLVERGTVHLERFAPAVDLLIRLWVANVFWKSGLTKIATWESTLYLFEYEYAVPLLSTEAAAVVTLRGHDVNLNELFGKYLRKGVLLFSNFEIQSPSETKYRDDGPCP